MSRDQLGKVPDPASLVAGMLDEPLPRGGSKLWWQEGREWIEHGVVAAWPSTGLDWLRAYLRRGGVKAATLQRVFDIVERQRRVTSRVAPVPRADRPHWGRDGSHTQIS